MTVRPTIAFDLDGTLVDTAPDLVDTLNLVLQEAGLPPVPFTEARDLVGGGARALIERGLAYEHEKIPTAEVDRMLSRFLVHYDAHLADRSRAFPGVEDALATLAAKGAILVVVTNKLERFSVKLLAALGLLDRFALVAGADTFAVRKPDPGHLLAAVAQAGGRSDGAVMVGDSETDVLTARRARVPVVAVGWGYSRTPAAKLGADRLIERMKDLPAAVEALVDLAGARK
ncbi:MAG TPA: HAD family hydrolase [Xanthobacteraceae bacterium]|nr:HAD family hydrolase [Xanthobacteraceae bacterium]